VSGGGGVGGGGGGGGVAAGTDTSLVMGISVVLSAGSRRCPLCPLGGWMASCLHTWNGIAVAVAEHGSTDTGAGRCPAPRVEW